MNMSQLKILALSSNGIDAKACKHLAPALTGMTQLEELFLSKNLIDDEACEYLALALVKMAKLNRLIMHENPISEGSKQVIRAWCRDECEVVL